MNHSIRNNFTLIFIALVAALLIIMYCVYSFFLQEYYRRIKIDLLESAYQTVDTAVQSAEKEDKTLLGILNEEYDQNVENSSVTAMFRSLSERSNIGIVMLDSSGMMAATSRESEWDAMKLRAYLAFSEVYGDDVEFTFPLNRKPASDKTNNKDSSESDANNSPEASDGKTVPISGKSAADGSASDTETAAEAPWQPIEILKKTDNYTIQMFNDRRSRSGYLECWGTFSDGDTHFLMTMPIASIEEGTEISKRFLFGVSAIILVMGAVAVYFTTGLITKPINDLAHISERMSDLDFSARYEGKQKNEIGVLGASMNSMSDKLEQTILELKDANAKLQEDIDAKIKIDEMRKEFIADVSHELKTPISIIEGYAEGLVEGLAEDKETRDYYCGVIMDESAKMNKMVKQLTSLITYEFGEDVNDCVSFDLSELIRSVLEAQKIRLNEAGAVLITELESPAPVLADEFKIEEAFTNYLNNAINHLDGQKRIRVRLEEAFEGTDQDAGRMWKVSVYNDGEPIPEESLDQLWDKFYKVDKSRSRQYGGSGIGLSIVKAVVEAHKGSCGVKNTEEGVEFMFMLPAEKILDEEKVK
ncbi:MAG: HAMP domain-containing protein [Lachnospiraceae bacterium]|nr:HAMP domain-containing protein [Lachnospiraceae bacterium]